MKRKFLLLSVIAVALLVIAKGVFDNQAAGREAVSENIEKTVDAKEEFPSLNQGANPVPTKLPTLVPSTLPTATISPSMVCTVPPTVAPTPTVISTVTPTCTPSLTPIPKEESTEIMQSESNTISNALVVPQEGIWQLKGTTGKKYIILGTDDDNVGNAKFFRLLRSYGFPYTMNTEAESARKRQELGADTDDTIFTSEDAPALFPNGVDVVTLGKYLYDSKLGEVAQHGSSACTLWDSGNLTGDFLTSLHEQYVKHGGIKTEIELRDAITELLSSTDGSQGAVYVNESRMCLEEIYGFPIYTVGIWGGAPKVTVDGIECNLNHIKGTTNYDWRVNNYMAVASVLGSYKENTSTYDLSRVTCGVEEVVDYIDRIEPGKACEFFWHMPFNDEPDITKWRTLFSYIKSLVDNGELEVVTRKQYAELGEWVKNPVTKISIDRPNILLREEDSDSAYIIKAIYADGSSKDVSDEAILNRCAVNTEKAGVYTVKASYRGFNETLAVSVIDTGYTTPEKLKEQEYWFVAKNETKKIMMAGNTTGTFGRVGASESTMIFLNCKSGKCNAWISNDNGATWIQVNDETVHYKNIKTNAREGNVCFNFGCAERDQITWYETSGNFDIEY